MNPRVNSSELTRHGIDEWYHRVSSGQAEIARLESELRNAQSGDDIESARQALANEDVKVKELMANEYLNHLWNHPSILIDSLIDDIRAQLTAYEAAYPANQTADVQKAMFEIERGVNYIEVICADDVTERRKKYYELVGLLQYVLECNANVYSQGLDKVLEAILVKHRIAANEAKEAYKDLCNSHLDALPRLTNELVSQHLNRKYAEARQRLRQAFDVCYRARNRELNVLLNKGIAVLAEVEREKIVHAQKGDNLFDAKFYTKLLDKTAKVMLEPQNEALRAEYHQLATHNKSGRASLPAKVAGAMLALIGAAVLVTTIVADVMSLGASVPVLLTGKIGGGVACLMGIGLFASGVRSGIALAADNFEAAAKGVKTAPPAGRGSAAHSFPNERSALLSHRR